MQRESECSMLAQCLITRGDMTAWRGMCGKAELEWADQWYKPRGGGVLGLMFSGYVPLASQSPHPILVYFLANYRPHLSHFLENVIFAIPT